MPHHLYEPRVLSQNFHPDDDFLGQFFPFTKFFLYVCLSAPIFPYRFRLLITCPGAGW
jgi:hypothetical protein